MLNEYQAAIWGLYAAIFGLVLTIIALILTIKALIMARSQTIDLTVLKSSATGQEEQLQRVGKSLGDSETRLKAVATLANEISGSLSTKAIGAYPDYVDEITVLLNRASDHLQPQDGAQKARTSVTIVCDVPCYCMFSGQRQWQGYKSALERALLNRAQRELRIVWMNSDRRKQLLKEQFKPANDSDTTSWKTPVVTDRLATFLELYARNKSVELLTYREFEAIVEQQHAKMIDSMQAVQPKEHKDRLHLMFWIVDGEEAIFAIPNFTERGQGLGFYTRDPKIINGLQSIYTRLNEEAEAPVTATAR